VFGRNKVSTITTTTSVIIANHIFFRNEELKYQAVVRDEMTQLETALVTTQREYEILKVRGNPLNKGKPMEYPYR